MFPIGFTSGVIIFIIPVSFQAGLLRGNVMYSANFLKLKFMFSYSFPDRFPNIKMHVFLLLHL